MVDARRDCAGQSDLYDDCDHCHHGYECSVLRGAVDVLASAIPELRPERAECGIYQEVMQQLKASGFGYPGPKRAGVNASEQKRCELAGTPREITTLIRKVVGVYREIVRQALF